MLSGMASNSWALPCTSSRYSATSGTNCRPRLTYRATSISPTAISQSVRRKTARENADNRLTDLSSRRLQAGVGSEQHHVILFRSEEHTSELQSRENLVCRL